MDKLKTLIISTSLVLFIFGLLGMFTFAAENESDYDFAGNVRRVEQRRFDLNYVEKFGEGEWRETPAEDMNINTEYTPFQKLASIEELDDKGRLTAKQVYRYDRNENSIELNYYDADGALEEKLVYRRDGLSSYGKQSLYNWHTLITYGSKGGIRSRTIFEHNKNGFARSMTTYKTNGSLERSYSFKWDERGNRVKETKHDGKGRMVWDVTHIFDKHDNQVGRLEYDKNYSFTGGFNHKFNRSGEIVESVNINEKGKFEDFWKYAYTYDKTGNWIKTIASKRVAKFGRQVFEPQYVDYRTIYYAEQNTVVSLGLGEAIGQTPSNTNAPNSLSKKSNFKDKWDTTFATGTLVTDILDGVQALTPMECPRWVGPLFKSTADVSFIYSPDRISCASYKVMVNVEDNSDRFISDIDAAQNASSATTFTDRVGNRWEIDDGNFFDGRITRKYYELPDGWLLIELRRGVAVFAARSEFAD